MDTVVPERQIVLLHQVDCTLMAVTSPAAVLLVVLYKQPGALADLSTFIFHC
jgi:hypothetical protein